MVRWICHLLCHGLRDIFWITILCQHIRSQGLSLARWQGDQLLTGAVLQTTWAIEMTLLKKKRKKEKEGRKEKENLSLIIKENKTKFLLRWGLTPSPRLKEKH